MTKLVVNWDRIQFIRKEVKEKIAASKFTEAKDLIEEIEGVVNDDNLETNQRFLLLSTAAKFYKKVKNYNKSANYSRLAINISKNIDKKYMGELIECYLDHAGLERKYKQFANARKLLAKLLAILESNKWKKSFDVGLIYRSLGLTFLAEEDYENGLNQLNLAVEEFKKSVDDTHPAIVEINQLICDTFVKVEEYEQAIGIQQQYIERYQQTGNKIKEAETRMKIGEIYYYINLKDARRSITEALSILEDIFKDRQHMSIAKAQLMLAELDENLGNFPRAMTYYKRSLKQLEGLFTTTHFMIVYVYSKIGTLSMKVNELKQAKKYLEKGLTISKDFPKIRLQFLYALGKLYSGDKRYEQALVVFGEFLTLLEQDNKKTSKAYADTLQAIAFNYIEQKEVEQAFVYYEQALSIYTQLKQDCLEEKGFAAIRLAYCFENIQNYDLTQAEYYYQYGVKSIEKVRNSDILEEALAAIIEFYNRNPNPKKKRQYEDKLVKLQIKKAEQ